MNLALGARGAIFVGTARYDCRPRIARHATSVHRGSDLLNTGDFSLFRMNFGGPPTRKEVPLQNRREIPAHRGYPRRRPPWYFVFLCMWARKSATSYWAAVHAEARDSVGPATRSRWAPMFFFAGLLGGRGAAAAISPSLKRSDCRHRRNPVGCGGENFLFLCAHSAVALFCRGLVFFAGLGFGKLLYPIYIAWLSKWFGEGAATEKLAA